MTEKKERIVIACVTFDTVKITKPIEYYTPTNVYLIHDIRDKNPKNIFKEFLNEVERIISNMGNGSIKTTPVNAKVTNFNIMLRTVLEIIEKEHRIDYKKEIYVNISSGSNEYAAAATVASMMNDYVFPFSVRTERYRVKDDESQYSIRNIYYENQTKPIGLAESVYSQNEKMELQKVNIEMPPEYLVRGLRILYEKSISNIYPKSGVMIKLLKDSNLWLRTYKTLNLNHNGQIETIPKESKNQKKQRQVDTVYYHRDFIDKWQKRKWVERDEYGKLVVTTLGKITLETFHTLENSK